MIRSKIIIICGPSGNGKTTITKVLAKELDAIPLHLDDLFFGHHYRNYDNPLMIAKAGGIIARKVADWTGKSIVADFLFYKKELRDAFKPDVSILMDTGGNMNEFDRNFFNYIVTEKNAEQESKKIVEFLNNYCNNPSNHV